MNTRKWIWALAVSVGINLFFAGFLVSRCSRAKHFHDRHPGAHRSHVPLMFRARKVLGDSVPEDVRQQLRERGQAARAERRKLRQARKRARRALEAEPYDAAELADALEDLRGASLTIQKTMHEGLIELAGSITPEQRQRLADANWKQRRRRR